MPQATVDTNSFEKFDLKSAPPDGYVMLRPLPYGMKLSRRDKATRMKMIAEGPKGGRGAATGQTIELETYSEWATFFDFSYCIGEHNLQNPDSTLIDFTKAMSLKTLDPKVGSEIERYINDLNEEEDELSLEDFLRPSDTLSENESDKSNSDSLDKPPTEVADS